MTKEKRVKVKIGASEVIMVLIFIFNAYGFTILKFNDLAHLECNQKETILKIEKVGDEVKEQGKKLSKIEGYLLSKKEDL